MNLLILAQQDDGGRPVSKLGLVRSMAKAAAIDAGTLRTTGGTSLPRASVGQCNTMSADPRLGTGISGVRLRTTRLPIRLKPVRSPRTVCRLPCMSSEIRRADY